MKRRTEVGHWHNTAANIQDHIGLFDNQSWRNLKIQHLNRDNTIYLKSWLAPVKNFFGRSQPINTASDLAAVRPQSGELMVSGSAAPCKVPSQRLRKSMRARRYRGRSGKFMACISWTGRPIFGLSSGPWPARRGSRNIRPPGGEVCGKMQTATDWGHVYKASIRQVWADISHLCFYYDNYY